MDWLHPMFVGDEIDLEAVVESASSAAGVLTLSIHATNQNGRQIMKGQAKVKVSERVAAKREAEPAGRTALVTGGGRGIGAAIARALAAKGVAVAVGCRRDVAAAAAVVAEIDAAGGRAAMFQGDVSDAGAVETMLGQIASALGPIDIVVHGATPPLSVAKVTDLDLPGITPYLEVFLGGALEIAKRVVPGMAERHFGRFVFLGTSALQGTPPAGWGAYVTAKEALWGLARTMAQELGPFGITTNMVSPGLTVTDLTAHVAARVKEVEARRNPLRRLAMVEDTAAFVAFLSGDEAGFINGAHLPVNGGLA